MDEYEEHETFTLQLSATRVRDLAEWVQGLPKLPDNVASIEMLVNYDDAGQVRITATIEHVDQPAPHETPVAEKPQTYWIFWALKNAAAIIIIAATLGWLLGKI